MTTIRPKKALGQHFLTDDSIAARIADTLSGYRGLPVLEVGPGTGVLTRHLLAAGHDLAVVEIDPASISYLKTHYPALEGRILDKDFLAIDLRTWALDRGVSQKWMKCKASETEGFRECAAKHMTEPESRRQRSNSLFLRQPFCVIGNYPYYISSQIFFKVIEERDRVVCCSGMIQKEVAERLAARPGSRASGILSALVQPWYDVEYLFTVPPSAFNPPPKVHSAVVRLVRNDRQTLGCDERLYKTVVKTAFNRRRKTLRNALEPLLGRTFEGRDDRLFSLRAEQLTLEDFVHLTHLAETHLQNAPMQSTEPTTPLL